MNTTLEQQVEDTAWELNRFLAYDEDYARGHVLSINGNEVPVIIVQYRCLEGRFNFAYDMNEVDTFLASQNGTPPMQAWKAFCETVPVRQDPETARAVREEGYELNSENLQEGPALTHLLP